MPLRDYKIIFTGTMGAGKTTAIAAISEIPPINTDVRNHDLDKNKSSTTVALDYGELTLDGGNKLRLYGTPGQERFNFMWNILAQGALGLIILIDNTRANPIADMTAYLDYFSDLIDHTAVVIGVGRTETANKPDIDDFYNYLATQGKILPVLAVDVRKRKDVIVLLNALLSTLEHG